MKEIERKFLINDIDEFWKLLNYHINSSYLLDTYYIDNNTRIRYKYKDKDHYIVSLDIKKNNNTNNREELNFRLVDYNLDEYKKNCKNTCKYRTEIFYDDHLYYLDEYVTQKNHPPLNILEIEFDTIDKCNDFILPDEFNKLTTEVTNIKKFRDYNIAKHEKLDTD